MKHACTWVCKEHGPVVCGCGLRAGDVQMRNGVLCYCYEDGLFLVRAPRAADVALARRVVATMAGSTSDISKHLVANLTSLREKT